MSYTYILTDRNKEVLRVGVTRDIGYHLIEHLEISSTFRRYLFKRYHCVYLVYYERFTDFGQALHRKKEIQQLDIGQKFSLVSHVNANWDFLNDSFNEFV